MEIITRKEALARGLTHYCTGEPCKKCGEITKRYTSSGNCIECMYQKLKAQSQARAAANSKKRIAVRDSAPNFEDFAHLPASGKEARALGVTRYFTGAPCPRGHIAPRMASGGQCSKCLNIQARNWERNNRERLIKRLRVYRAANLDRIKSYPSNNPELVRLRAKEWNKNNPEAFKARVRRWIAKNPERRREIANGWANANREQIRAKNKAYKKANPHKVRAWGRLREATKLQATPAWLSDAQKAEIIDIYNEAVIAEQLTGVKHHVDHIEPLRGKDRWGLHVPWNLQILTANENLRKSNRPVRHFHWKKL